MTRKRKEEASSSSSSRKRSRTTTTGSSSAAASAAAASAQPPAPPQPAVPDECGICFEAEFDFRGKLDSCRHAYCFPCISKWSQSSNTCPQCKARFKSISKTGVKSGKVESVLKCTKTDLGSSSATAAAAGPVAISAHIQALLAQAHPSLMHSFGPFSLVNSVLFGGAAGGMMDWPDDDEDDEDYDEDDYCMDCGEHIEECMCHMHHHHPWMHHHHFHPHFDDEEDDEDYCPECGEHMDECMCDEDEEEEGGVQLLGVTAAAAAAPVIQSGAGTADQPFELVDDDEDL